MTAARGRDLRPQNEEEISDRGMQTIYKKYDKETVPIRAITGREGH